MNREEIINKLQEIFEDIFDYNQELNEGVTISDIKEWDSLAHITLIASIEDEFAIKIPAEKIPTLKSVKEMIKVIKKSPRNKRILFHFPSGFNSITFFSLTSSIYLLNILITESNVEVETPTTSLRYLYVLLAKVEPS